MISFQNQTSEEITASIDVSISSLILRIDDYQLRQKQHEVIHH